MRIEGSVLRVSQFEFQFVFMSPTRLLGTRTVLGTVLKQKKNSKVQLTTSSQIRAGCSNYLIALTSMCLERRIRSHR